MKKDENTADGGGTAGVVVVLMSARRAQHVEQYDGPPGAAGGDR